MPRSGEKSLQEDRSAPELALTARTLVCLGWSVQPRANDERDGVASETNLSKIVALALGSRPWIIGSGENQLPH